MSIEEEIITKAMLKKSVVDEEKELKRLLELLKGKSFIAEPPITNKNKIKIFIKRFVRKLTHWRIAPLIQQQNEFNKSVVELIEHILNQK